MKTCSKCKQEKYLDEFNKGKAPDGFAYYCRECSKQWYADHKDQHVANAIKNRKAAREKNLLIVAKALSVGCVDCGNKDIRVLDFDHINGIKVKGVMKMAQEGWPTQKVIDEITKCVPRCRNCHAIITYDRLGGSWRDTN